MNLEAEKQQVVVAFGMKDVQPLSVEKKIDTTDTEEQKQNYTDFGTEWLKGVPTQNT
jgi:hypothetical protein